VNRVAGVVDRAGRAVRDRDVLGHTHARLAARVLQAPGMAATGLPALSAEQAVPVGDVDVRANTVTRLAAGGLAAARDRRDGVAGVVAEHGVLSVTFCVTQRPIRTPN